MTLRMKVILGFCVMTIPLVCLLLYTNYYSGQVVRKQVATYNSGLLTLYGNQIDQTLENDNSYLYKLANQEPDIRSLIYNMNDPDEYLLTRTRVLNKLYSDIPYNNSFYLNFVYIPFNGELIVAQNSQKSYAESLEIQNFLGNLFSGNTHNETFIQFGNRWTHCQIGDTHFLLRFVVTDTNTYVGALIKSDDLLAPLQEISRERNMNVFLLNNKGGWLTSALPDGADEVIAAVREGFILLL